MSDSFEMQQRKLQDRIQSYAREWIDGEYKFYKPYRMVPMKQTYKVNVENFMKGRVNKDGTGKTYTNFLKFKQEWFEQDHWAYGEKAGVWYVYRVRMKDGVEIDRKICYSSPSQMTKDAILAMILDGNIRVSDEQMLHESQSYARKTIQHQNVWSIQYDGLSALQLMFEKPKMSFEDIKNVIVAEGGSIDENMIIHKGTAQYHF